MDARAACPDLRAVTRGSTMNYLVYLAGEDGISCRAQFEMFDFQDYCVALARRFYPEVHIFVVGLSDARQGQVVWSCQGTLDKVEDSKEVRRRFEKMMQPLGCIIKDA